MNDYFGYWTVVINDGCYQLLVPARPVARNVVRRKSSLVVYETAEALSDLGTPKAAGKRTRSTDNMRFSNHVYTSRVKNSDDQGSHNSRNISGDASPMTFYAEPSFTKASHDEYKDTSFGRLAKNAMRESNLKPKALTYPDSDKKSYSDQMIKEKNQDDSFNAVQKKTENAQKQPGTKKSDAVFTKSLRNNTETGSSGGELRKTLSLK